MGFLSTSLSTIAGYDVEDEELARFMIDLQKKGCHNINFVSPTHVVAPILRSLVIAKEKGLKVHVINSHTIP